MSEDGLRALSIEDYGEAEWEKMGLWIKSPPYAKGMYNTELIVIKDSEKDLFIIRKDREVKSKTDVTLKIPTVLENI